jgi:hypothetical protein
MTNVALSGASGGIGAVLRPALLKLGVGLRSAGGRNALTPLAQRHQGSSFVSIDYIQPDQRPSHLGA